MAEILLLVTMLEKPDPVSFFVLGERLHRALQTEDDGSASFLLNAAEELLYVLEEPVSTQVRQRNIFEIIFDGMERAVQRDRFERLCWMYSDVGKRCDPSTLLDVEPGQRVIPR